MNNEPIDTRTRSAVSAICLASGLLCGYWIGHETQGKEKPLQNIEEFNSAEWAKTSKDSPDRMRMIGKLFPTLVNMEAKQVLEKLGKPDSVWKTTTAAYRSMSYSISRPGGYGAISLEFEDNRVRGFSFRCESDYADSHD